MPNNNVHAEDTTAAKVFVIPELVELVLIQIAQYDEPDDPSRGQQMKTVFRLQQVNSLFQKTVRKSRGCRQAMFLDDAGEDEESLTRCNPFVVNILSIDHKSVSSEYTSSGNKLHCTLHIRDKHLPPVPLLYLPTRWFSAIPRLSRTLGPGNDNKSFGSWQQTLICSKTFKLQIALNVYSHGRRFVGPELSHGVNTLGELERLVVKEVRRGMEIVKKMASRIKETGEAGSRQDL